MIEGSNKKGQTCIWLIEALITFLMILSFGGTSGAQDKQAREDELLREASMIDHFHEIFYKTQPYLHTKFLGIESAQYPSDNWIMQEIISETKPDYVIETGTARGGTTLFYAVIMAQANPRGKIITIDTSRRMEEAEGFPVWKERVEVLTGSSVDPELVKKIAREVRGKRTLVTLDSDHRKEHVLKELEVYSPLVPVGGYLVVQDTHLGGHPVNHASAPQGAGPFEAVEEFLKKNRQFVPDKSREKYLITQYPSGFLKRVK